MSNKYLLKPKADQDLDDQGYYPASVATPDLAHRFLVAAHETFTLLSRNPLIGWLARLEAPGLKTLRVFSISGFEKMLVLYRPLHDGVEIIRVVHGSRELQALARRQGLEQ